MAWDGYLEYDGVEIVNVSRVEAYAAAAKLRWFRPQFRAPSLREVLADAAYTGVVADNAPWYDAKNPYSTEFYGAYPLDMGGIADSTRTATVVEGLGDGGVTTLPRANTKTMVFNLILVAASEAGAEYGYQWLKEVLNGNPCSEPGCVGGNLKYFASEPLLLKDSANCEGRVQPVSSTPSVVSSRLSRTLRRVQTTVGVTTTAKHRTTDRGAVWNVQFTMTANIPFEFGEDVVVGSGFVRNRTNHVTNPSFEVDTAGWTAAGATLGRSNTESLFGSYAATLTATTNGVAYYMGMTGTLPGSVAGDVWSGGAWVYSPRTGNVDVIIQAYTSGSVFISNQTTTVPVEAGEWVWVESGPKTMPATTGKASIVIQMPATGVVAAEILRVDGVLLEKSSVLGGFFDGDTSAPPLPDIWNWTGTPHASTSIQTASAYMTPTRTNYCKNPSAEVNTTGWLQNACTVTRSTSQFKFGTASFALTATSTAQYWINLTTGSLAPAAAGQVWRAGAWIRMPRSGTAQVWLQSWTSGGAAVDNVAGPVTACAANTWTWVESTAVTLTGAAAFAGLAPLINATAVNGEVSYVDGVLLEKASVLGPYFDGSTVPGTNEPVKYAWQGTAHNSFSTATPDYAGTWVSTPYSWTDEENCYGDGFAPAYDPLFPTPTAPPPPPAITWGNSVPPTTWERTRFTIPDAYIPLYGRVAPIFELTAPLDESRNTRIRIYPDFAGTGLDPLEECAFAADFVVSYIPAFSTLVIDAAAKAIYLDTDLGRMRADSLVLSSSGGLFKWPELSCGFDYVVTIDTPVGASTQSPVIDLTLVGRSA